MSGTKVLVAGKLPSLNIPAVFVLCAANPIPPGTASPRLR